MTHDRRAQDVVTTRTKEARSDVHSANLKGLIHAKLAPKVAWSDDKLTSSRSMFAEARDRSKNILCALMYGAENQKLGLVVKLLYRAIGLADPKGKGAWLGARARTSLARTLQHRTGRPAYGRQPRMATAQGLHTPPKATQRETARTARTFTT